MNRWFLAELVMEFRVEGEDRNVVHVDTVLVEADTRVHAWHAALELGRQADHTYVNTQNLTVTKTFRGIRQLLVLWEGLEHGSELFYTEHVGLSEDKIREWTGPREELAAFLAPPDDDGDSPNLMPAEMARLLLAREPRGVGIGSNSDTSAASLQQFRD